MHAGPKLRRLVLVGGGHSHAIFLQMWAMAPRTDTEVILISPESRSAYSGMLPGVIAGLVPPEAMFIDLRRLAKAAGAVFIADSVLELDLKGSRLILAQHPSLSFDFLSLNAGSQPRRDHVPGAADYAQPVKPTGAFLDHWDKVRKRAREGMRLVLVGGGAGGVELALSMRASGRLPESASLTLVHAGSELLPQFNSSTRRRLSRALQKKNVKLELGAAVTEVEAQQLRLASGHWLPFDVLYWVTDASPPPWIERSGLRVDERGFALTNSTLLCEGHRNIFAVGDCASVSGQKRPKSGVFAVRMGSPLFYNIKAAIAYAPLKTVKIQKKALALIGTGDRRAVASRGVWTLEGAYLWRLKEAIDQRFMQRFERLPLMLEPADKTKPKSSGKAPLGKIRCSGCGAKIPAHVLSEVLQSISRDYPAVVAEGRLSWGLPSREDVCLWQAASGSRILQSIDYFPSLVDDPFLMGQIACQHAFNDVLVKGADPHSALVLAVLPYMAEHLSLDQLYQLLAGVAKGLDELGASLAGGHSAEGEKLAIGLTVTGLSDGRLLRKEAGRPGDFLLLTKALGTGVIFAGEMEGKAKSSWIDAAISSMLRSQKNLLPLIRGATVHAATDITGFGLLGHLQEMLRSGEMVAELWPEALPLLDGALELLQGGVASSLLPANRRFQEKVKGSPSVEALWDLMADPQTSGGFLLSVAAETAPRLLRELQQAGFASAQVIGRLRQSEKPYPPHRVELLAGQPFV